MDVEINSTAVENNITSSSTDVQINAAAISTTINESTVSVTISNPVIEANITQTVIEAFVNETVVEVFILAPTPADLTPYARIDGAEFTGAIKAPTVTTTESFTLSYVDDALDNIAYVNGTEKDFSYNGDGTLAQMVVSFPDASVVTKDFTYSDGVLTGVAVS